MWRRCARECPRNALPTNTAISATSADRLPWGLFAMCPSSARACLPTVPLTSLHPIQPCAESPDLGWSACCPSIARGPSPRRTRTQRPVPWTWPRPTRPYAAPRATNVMCQNTAPDLVRWESSCVELTTTLRPPQTPITTISMNVPWMGPNANNTLVPHPVSVSLRDKVV